MHYIIIGNGVAGTEAALAIRRRHSPKEARITLISDETDYFFSRTALMYAYMEKLDRREMEPYERKVYDRQKIARIRDRVVDLNADAQTITLSSDQVLSYDRLLLAVGTRARKLPHSGLDAIKEGVVNFVSMQDLDACERLTWSTEQAVVIGGGLIGIELAECFHHHRIKTTFLVREPYFWPMALGPEEGRMVSEHIRAHGIDLRLEDELESVEADETGRVKELITRSGKTIPCQMLGIAIGVQPSVGWLEDVTTPPTLGRGIRVDESFRTSLPGVFAAGDCAEIDRDRESKPLLETIWYSAKRQGELAGLSMIGDEVDYEPPIFFNSSKFFDVEFTTVGDVTDVPAGTRTLYRKMPGKNISQRIVHDGDRVLGFNMLGSRWDHTLLQRWVAQRRPIDYVLEHLREAQFDVEFGRIKLEKMTEEEKVL
ncbi:MAG: NAD(P)/FAD-dependent oxidoreductase [Bradymonadaceae bacterium]